MGINCQKEEQQVEDDTQSQMIFENQVIVAKQVKQSNQKKYFSEQAIILNKPEIIKWTFDQTQSLQFIDFLKTGKKPCTKYHIKYIGISFFFSIQILQGKQQINDQMFQQIMKLLEVDKQIIELEINCSKNSLNDQHVEILSNALIKNSRIQKLLLDLKHNKITDKGCEQISKFIRLNENIKQIELNFFVGNKISQKNKQNIHDAIVNNQSIIVGVLERQQIKKNIKIKIATFNEKETQNFISFLNDNQYDYTHLFDVECHFQNCELDDNFMKKVGNLLAETRISKKLYFNCQNSDITNLGIKKLTLGVLQNDRIHSLTLDITNNPQLDNKVVDDIDSTININKSFKELHLFINKGNCFSAQKLKKIRQSLLTNKILKIVSLDGIHLKNNIVISKQEFGQSDYQKLLNLITQTDYECEKLFNINANLQCISITDRQIDDLMSKLITNTTIVEIKLLLYGSSFYYFSNYFQ